MIDWKTKLTSRKLWAAVAEFISMLLLLVFGVASGTVEKVVALIMAGGGLVAYILAEGWIDAKAASVEPVILPDEAVYDAVPYEEAAEGAEPDGV